MKALKRSLILIFLSCFICGCSSPTQPASSFQAVAVENFLADIAQNIAGDRLTVRSLIPYGVEPHEFDPTPKDMTVVAESDLLIVNGGGLEGWLAGALQNIGGNRILVTASTGLTSRPADSTLPAANPISTPHATAAVDPHFWLNPVLVKTYVDNILQGLIQMDPSGSAEYRQNAENYKSRLDELDGWIRSQVDLIPAAQRLLITDHEDLGYFADRYGFTILGTVFPGVSPDAEPSASQFADLIQKIRSSHLKVIFLDVGTNTQLADQISQETGCRVVTDLYIHSLTPPGGSASTYLDMMRYDVNILVEALR